MWRKTRSPNENSECIGTDGNRNFPFEWGGGMCIEDTWLQIYTYMYLYLNISKCTFWCILGVENVLLQNDRLGKG